MPSHKIHVIEPDFSGTTWATAVARRDALGRAIATLAQSTGEPVWFHDYKTPLMGAPVVIVECSDAFIEKVKSLPEFGQFHEVWEVMATERSPKLQSYFMEEKAQPCAATYRPKSTGPKF